MQLKAIMVKAIIEKRRAVLDTASPKHTVIPCLTRHLQNTRGHVVLDTVSPKHTVMPCLTRHLLDTGRLRVKPAMTRYLNMRRNPHYALKEG